MNNKKLIKTLRWVQLRLLFRIDYHICIAFYETNDMNICELDVEWKCPVFKEWILKKGNELTISFYYATIGQSWPGSVTHWDKIKYINEFIKELKR